MSSTHESLVLGLIALGLAQIGGDALQRTGELLSPKHAVTVAGHAIKGLAAATCASPAPKVFSVARGLETFSTTFFVEWAEQDGTQRSVELSAAVYARLRGPYNRRNAYGAALAYGPVLAADERTRPMLELVLDFALTGEAPLLTELGIDASARTGPVRIRYEPRAGAELGTLPVEIGPARR